MKTLTRKNILTHLDLNWSYVIFIMWPFAGFLVAIFNFKYKTSKNLVILFSALFGLTLVIYSEGLDAYTYAKNFSDVAREPISNFFKIVGELYVSDDGELDIFLPLLYFVLSRFTDNVQVLFMVFALILSLLLVANIKFLYNLYATNKNLNSLLYMLFFISLVPATNINHFRWYTALLVFILACQYIFFKGKKRYIILAFSCILIHFSFIIPFLLLLAYLLIGNRFSIYYILLIASFFFSAITLPYLQNIVDSMSGGAQLRVKGYTNELYVEDVKEKLDQRIWVLQYSTSIAKYYILAALIFLKHRTKLFDRKTDNVYAFALLILCFANFGQEIEAISTRFTLTFLVFGSIALLRAFVNRKGKGIHPSTYVGTLVYIMVTIVSFRMGMELINVNLFLPIIFTPIFLDTHLSLYQFFR